MGMRRVAWAVAVAVVWSGGAAIGDTGHSGYRNVVNEPFATVADGPMAGLVIDVVDPAAVGRAAARGQVGRAVGRREGPHWFRLLKQRGLLPANQPAPALPQVAVGRLEGRLLLPDLARSRQTGVLGDDANRLSFDFTPAAGDANAVAWSEAQRTRLQQFLADIENDLLQVFGPPAFANTVRVVHDPGLNELNMAVYDATNNTVRIELLNDIDYSDKSQTPIDEYDEYVLTMAVLRAYRDDAFIGFDAWEDGMLRAAHLLAIAQGEPDFGFLARDFNLLFTAYDVLNQPGLGSPSFLGAESGSAAIIMREAIGVIRAYLAQAAWLKAYAENPNLFRDFNDRYYDMVRADPSMALNVPRLKAVMQSLAPQVEGLSFHDWYRRQHAFDTSVIPGAKLYIFNIPQKDFITGEPTNSLPMNIYHFRTTEENRQLPLTGRVALRYLAYDGFDLTNAVEGAVGTAGTEARIGEAGNPPGIGSAVPLFFNIAGDQGVQQQRIEVIARVNGMERRVWFPNDVAVSNTRVKNHLYGLVTNGFQGTLRIEIGAREAVETQVIQGAFGVRVPDLPVPQPATFTFTPNSSGGSQPTAVRRNVMFLGRNGSGIDVETGDQVIVLDTDPEQFDQLGALIPSGLRMITFPAWARRDNLAGIFGINPGELLLARADSAATTFEPWRINDIYRLFPNTPPFQPGYGFWVNAATDLNVNYQGVEASRQQPFRQFYPPGWIQIGNPWDDLNLTLASLQFQDAEGGSPVSLTEARTRGLISSGVFRYNPDTRGYELLADADILQPFRGYWLNVLADRGVSVIYPNSLGAGRAAAPGRGRQVEGWQASLVAASENYLDKDNRFGQVYGAGHGPTAFDAAKPPPFGDHLQVSFVHTDWGNRSGRYAVDLREDDGSAQTWDVLVESAGRAETVTLSWPDLASVPASVSLLLTDLDTGARRFLRTTGSYRLDLPAGGSRRLRLTAGRMTAGRLAISGLTVAAGRSGRSVTYTLTQPAEVSLFLTSPAGRRLQTLASGRASGRGVDQVALIARDEAGRPLPAGLYQLTLVATSEDGQQVRMNQIVRLER